MTSVIVLKKDLEKLRKQVGPPEDIVIVWSWGGKDEPHGEYGCTAYHINSGTWDWPKPEEEREWLKDIYEAQKKDYKILKNMFPSVEDFLKAQRCTCPVHQNVTKDAEKKR